MFAVEPKHLTPPAETLRCASSTGSPPGARPGGRGPTSALRHQRRRRVLSSPRRRRRRALRSCGADMLGSRPPRCRRVVVRRLQRAWEIPSLYRDRVRDRDRNRGWYYMYNICACIPGAWGACRLRAGIPVYVYIYTCVYIYVYIILFYIYIYIIYIYGGVYTGIYTGVCTTEKLSLCRRTSGEEISPTLTRPRRRH